MTETTARDVGMRFDGTDDLAEQLRALRNEVEQLRAQVVRLDADLVRLDADLDESRRLNLRAAELLDVVYEELGARRPGREGTS
jgi:septal ring factor EnvC (AmiA/AmiB activator)